MNVFTQLSGSLELHWHGKKDPIILASAHAQLGAPLNSYFSTSAWLAACRGCGLLGGENKFNLNGED
jgi:hypothetical protein